MDAEGIFTGKVVFRQKCKMPYNALKTTRDFLALWQLLTQCWMPLNEIQSLWKVHQPSHQLLCSTESFSSFIPVTCLSAPVAASILSAGATDCQLHAAAVTGGLLQGQESAPKSLEKSHLPWSFLMREDRLQARSMQCSKHCPVCHIHTELKQKQYYHRDQNMGILHLSLWDLIYACFTSASSFPVPSLSQIHTATVGGFQPPPKPHVQPGAFLLQVWKGEFKFSEI